MRNEHDRTVLIIDGDSDVSHLLAERLSLVPGIRVVGETSNVILGAELAHQLKPDLILADFGRTGPPRVETYRWLARVSPASILVAHTSCLANGEGQALREAGVARCLLKGEGVKRLAEQIIETAGQRNGRVAAGGTEGGGGGK
jgi:DNA-binding NarL/FixJ family response regulator